MSRKRNNYTPEEKVAKSPPTSHCWPEGVQGQGLRVTLAAHAAPQTLLAGGMPGIMATNTAFSHFRCLDSPDLSAQTRSSRWVSCPTDNGGSLLCESLNLETEQP
jgi:hypothetical protein